MGGRVTPHSAMERAALIVPRFTNHTLSYEDQKTNLSFLMQSYLSSMSDIGAETWIIHGTLLGWWWNGKVCSPQPPCEQVPDIIT